jgi:hypothetical protein
MLPCSMPMKIDVRKKFESISEHIRPTLLIIRQAIFEVAEADKIGDIEETLKWGEPSYRAKGGSTVRINRVSKSSQNIAVYFHCQTTLIETFKEIYGDLFNYEGKRAIIINGSEEIPMKALKHCISMALRYHKIKHLPLPGC